MGTVSIRDAPPRCVAGEAAVTVAMDATKRTLGQKSARCTGCSLDARAVPCSAVSFRAVCAYRSTWSIANLPR